MAALGLLSDDARVVMALHLDDVPTAAIAAARRTYDSFRYGHLAAVSAADGGDLPGYPGHDPALASSPGGSQVDLHGPA